MDRFVPARRVLRTARLSLRPTEVRDAERAYEIQSDWQVTRMLHMARSPPDLAELRAWFADHAREWRQCEAFRFAVDLGGRLIGVVDLGEVEGHWGDLGFRFEAAAWGHGYAAEASRALLRFASHEIGLAGLRSGRAADSPASGRVLLKLGFVQTGSVDVGSLSRGETIRQIRYDLRFPISR